jgi:hypothetical protein
LTEQRVGVQDIKRLFNGKHPKKLVTWSPEDRQSTAASQVSLFFLRMECDLLV